MAANSAWDWWGFAQGFYENAHIVFLSETDCRETD